MMAKTGIIFDSIVLSGAHLSSVSDTEVVPLRAGKFCQGASVL